MPTHTQTQQHTKAQISPSEIFNHATQLTLPLPSFVILYLPVCLAALGSSVVSAVFPSFPFFCSSVQLFPRSPHQPLARTYRVQLCLILCLSLVFHTVWLLNITLFPSHLLCTFLPFSQFFLPACLDVSSFLHARCLLE